MINRSFEELGNGSSVLLTPSYCDYPDEINEEIIFWVEGVLLSIVGLIGIVGNIVTFYVLSKIPSKYNIFNKLLMQLISSDSISITLVFVDFSLRKSFHLLAVEDGMYGSVWPTFIYPFMKISNTWIMCCTMAITIER